MSDGPVGLFRKLQLIGVICVILCIASIGAQSSLSCSTNQDAASCLKCGSMCSWCESGTDHVCKHANSTEPEQSCKLAPNCTTEPPTIAPTTKTPITQPPTSTPTTVTPSTAPIPPVAPTLPPTTVGPTAPPTLEPPIPEEPTPPPIRIVRVQIVTPVVWCVLGALVVCLLGSWACIGYLIWKVRKERQGSYSLLDGL
mmetsp:Transcript_852/g.981  ORF Transcript_852/g.981 Transcript_852/m.981 type:complete len:198 (+) Transcript_852:36-629(+)